MSSPDKEQTPDSTVVGKRPYVVDYVKKPSLNVGDKVYLLASDGSRKGPYVVSSLPSTGKCTLSLENGTAVEGGAEVDTDDLEVA